MHIKNRVNLKRYLGLSLLSTALLTAFVPTPLGVLAMTVVFIATLVNHACLVEIVEESSQKTAKDARGQKTEKLDKFKLLQYGVVKFLVLIGALSLSVLLIGNKVILPLINYVVMIFILSSTLKTRENP